MAEQGREFNPDYIAGVLDLCGRGGFELTLPDTIDQAPRADYRVRFSLGKNEMLAGLLDEFFQQIGVVHRIEDRGSIRIDLRRKDAIKLLHEYLQGHSIELSRDLAFMTEYEFTQEGLVADAESTVRYAKTIEELHPDRRTSDRISHTARDVARELGVRISDIDPYPLPDLTMPSHLSPAYLAGVFDAKGRYNIAASTAPGWNLEYGISPEMEINKSALHPVTVSLLYDTLDYYDLDYHSNESDNIYTFKPRFIGIESMQALEDVIADHMIVSLPHLTAFQTEIYPRFENEQHKTRQGFYDILYIAEHELDLFHRERKYNTAFFAREWGDDIGTYDVSPDAT
jgi:hypothetical protein